MDSNLGMMLFSGDLSGAQSIGGLQGMARGLADVSEGSVFQQLLTQMLAGNTVIADAGGTGGAGTAQGKSEGTGDPLSALLFAGGNTTKARLLNTIKVLGESMESPGKSGESKAAKENGGAAEMLQAMMAGLTGTTVPVANLDKILAEIQNGVSEAEAISTVGSVMMGTGKPVISENKQLQNLVPQAATQAATQETAPAAEQAAAGQTAVQSRNSEALDVNALKEAIPVRQTVIETAAAVEEPGSVEKTSVSRKPAVSAGPKELEFSEPVKSGPAAETKGKTERPAEFLQQEIKPAVSAAEKQTAVPDIIVKDAPAAPAEKPEQKAEAVDDMDPGRIGLQNSVQSPAAVSEAAKPNQAQQIQTPDQYSQIQDEILTKLEQNGPTEFKMQLEPEDLGQIDIKLKLSEGKLVIDILAANSKTQALLTSQVDKLISSMGLQNVQVESVHVGQQSNPQTQDNSQSQGYSMNSAMDFSQRRQQEQYQQEILRNANLTGTFSLQQDEAQADRQVNGIASARYDSHRMNYSV